ncbi:MAG: 1-acyl-sn-glycerol-3-phosphate acyltransferase [Prolixibacteraceae bacterium]|nr:1-acyl-sn-glycerol-3-phosphate acyltransferase [Prolixibacteraceae bacterium]
MEGEIHKQGFQPIDIKKVVRGKNPRLAKRMPGFVYKWLSRILHLDEINSFMMENGHLRGIEFVDATINLVNISYTISGEENIPLPGRYIFAMNHPLGGLDGVIIQKFINEKIGPTITIVNDFLMELYPLKDWFLPINKVGGQARSSVLQVEELYKSDKNVLIFPAGLCSRKVKGKIVDLQWHKHFIQKAIEYKTDIIPIYFEGRNSNFFYNLAKLRKFLRIKFNIEMMFLVDELFKNRNKKFSIVIGKPIPYQSFNRSKKAIEWADEVKKTVYSLKNQE